MRIVLDTNVLEKRRGCAVVNPAEFMRIWSHRQPDPPQATQ
jgi:hypothetical protein